MGYFNIIDSLSDKRVNEGMLSKGGDTCGRRGIICQ